MNVHINVVKVSAKVIQVNLTVTWTQTTPGVGEYTWVRIRFLHECRKQIKVGM